VNSGSYVPLLAAALCPPSIRLKMPAEPAPEIKSDEFERQRQVSQQLAAPALEGYEIVAYIGEGTYGDVWQARDLKTDTLVAIKRLRKQPDQKSRAEVRMLAKLDEARGIVALKSIHLDSEPYCYVMEYMGGGTLADLIARHGKVPFRKAWRIFRELAEALSYVHRQDVVHCDIKPENILLDSRGNPRLSDFGQARGQGPRGSSLGTRFYMPPEQARLDAPDTGWDVYALGAILYQMLTGNKPRHSPQLAAELKERTQATSEMRDRLEKYAQHLERCEPLQAHRGLLGVTPEVADVIERCLMTDMAGRPKDAAEVLSLVERCEWRRRRRPLLILGGVAPAITLLAAGLVVIFGGIMALKKFEHKWVVQVVGDNQVVAKTIATEIEARFNDRIRVLHEQAQDSEWPELLALPPNDRKKERLVEKLQRLYQTHGEQRLRRWCIDNGVLRLTYGRMPSGNEEADEFDLMENVPGSLANKNVDEATMEESAMQLARAPLLSPPYRRKSNDPKRELWILSVSCGIGHEGTSAPVGILSGEIDYHEFNEAFARFESSAVFQRKVIVAHERGQTIYHGRLAAHVNRDEITAEVRKIDLKQKEHKFFAQAFDPPTPTGVESGLAGEEPLPVAFKDPWYAQEDKTEYYFSRTAANLASGQKLAIFVLHDKQVALAGFVEAERSACWLGFSLLGVGCAMLIGNIWILSRMLRHEDTSNDA